MSGTHVVELLDMLAVTGDHECKRQDAKGKVQSGQASWLSATITYDRRSTRFCLAPLAALVALAASPCACGGSADSTTGDVAETLLEAREAAGPNDATAADAGEAVAFVPVPPGVDHVGVFTIIWLAGTPAEMGRQQGELLHDVIAEAMAYIQGDVQLTGILMLARDLGLLDLAEQASYPEFIEECQGIVETAGDTGFTMDHCLALNFGDVLLEFLETGLPEETPGPGCSSVVAAGEATTGGRLLHARNLDWGGMDISFIHEHPLIQVRQPAGGRPHVFVGFPLNLSPYTGINLAGLAFGTHEADPAGPQEQSATGHSHVQMVGRMLATAESLDEVRTFLAGEKGMSAGILSVSDGDRGTGAVFEMTASAIAERGPEKGLVYATNHFLAATMLTKQAKPSSGSVLRLQRLDTLVSPGGAETIWGTIDETKLSAVMKDPLNVEIGPQTPEELAATEWDNDGSLGCNGPMHFVIFDPANRLFYVAAGTPPLHVKPYTCFSLEELLGLPAAKACPVGEIE